MLSYRRQYERWFPNSASAETSLTSRQRFSVSLAFKPMFWPGAGGRVGSVVIAPDAINAALRSLGVQRGQDRDEFESLGLGRCRDTDAWIDSAEE